MRCRAFSGVVVCVVALLTCACEHPSAKAEEHRTATQPDPVPHSRDADDVGRFIAGLPGTPGSTFAALEAEEPWQEHRRQLDLAWDRAGKKLITELRDFQKKELIGP